MDTVEKLRQERMGKTVSYTQFLAEYKKYDSKICYGFVEGKDDISYYSTIIKHRFSKDYSVKLYPSGGKEAVVYTHTQINWRKFSKKRIVFFIDKDLSDMVEDKNMLCDTNVYITDKYSIENDIVCKETLESVMIELLGFTSSSKDEVDNVVKLFEFQTREFENVVIPIMANIIMWKRKKVSPANYRNIKIKDVICIRNGVLIQKLDKNKTIEIVYKQSNVDISQYERFIIDNIIKEIEEKELGSSIIRGKYLAEFFILFCNSIHNDCKDIGITKTHTGLKLNFSDITRIIAPRCRAPKSLEIFLNSTIISYYQSIKL